jgi:hypothetical protein
VEAGGGQILYGPSAVPGGAWIVHCTDPQGAIFGLLDRRKRNAIGYFISSASRRSLGRAGLPRVLLNENSRLFAIAGCIIAI